MLTELRRASPYRLHLLSLFAGALLAAGCVSSLDGLDDVPGGTSDDGGPGADGDQPLPTSPPTLAPAKIVFRDADPRELFVGGDIAITPAATPDGVSEYRAYFGSSATARIGAAPISTSTSTTLTLPALGIPDGATFLLVFAANAKGEAPSSASIALRDNYAHYADISGTLDSVHNYAQPSAAISVGTKQLFVLSRSSTRGTNDYNNLVRCSLDGTGCMRSRLSTPVLEHPNIFVDDIASRFMFTGADNGNGVVTYNFCDFAGAACTLSTVTSAGDSPVGAVDPVNRYLYLFYSSLSAHPALFRCNYYDNTCGSGIFGDEGGPPGSAIIDPMSSKLLLVQAGPTLITGGPLGESPGATDIGAGAGVNAQEPIAIRDDKNRKLLVAARNASSAADKLALFQCDLTGANCKYVDASSGQPVGSGKSPSVAIDATRDKLYIATQNETGRPGLYRCNVDATACAYIDITAGQPANSGGSPKVLVDTVNDRLLVVTQVGTTDLRAGLFSLDLW